MFVKFKNICILFSLCFLGSALNAQSLPVDEAVPGGIIKLDLDLESNSRTTEPDVYFQGNKVLVYTHNNNYYALVGIPLNIRPGEYNIKYIDTLGFDKFKTFEVKSKNYKISKISIKDKNMVNPDSKTLRRIANDTKRIGQATSEYSELTLDKFAYNNGFSWKKSEHPLDNEDIILQQVALYLDPNGAGYIVICIDPNGIADKTIIGEYTGDTIPDNINLALTHDFYILNNPYNDRQRFISSKRSGNIVRFICDLPSPEALCLKYSFQENPDKIATSNCKIIKYTDQQDHTALFLQTTRKIQYGEIIGWPYGENYWNNIRFQSIGKIYKFLFNKNSGAIIKASLKKYVFFGSAEHCYLKKISLYRGIYWCVKRQYNNLDTNNTVVQPFFFGEITTSKLIQILQQKKGAYLTHPNNINYYLPFYEIIYLLIKYYNKNEHAKEVQGIIETHAKHCLAKRNYNLRAIACIFFFIIVSLISDYL